jgi:predicted porin
MMNKKLLAVAVAGAVAAPLAAQAEVTLYGRVILEQAYEDFDDGDKDDQWDVKSGTSRFGFKGTEKLGDNLEAFFRYEFFVQADRANIGDNNRLSFAGLRGGWGSIALGRQWTPFYDVIGAQTDIMEGSRGSQAYDRVSGFYRVSKSVRYDSPSLAGVQFSAMYITSSDDDADSNSVFQPQIGTNGQSNDVAVCAGGMDANANDGECDGKKGVDWYNLALSYTNGGLLLGASWAEKTNDNNDDYEFWGVSAGYEFEFSGGNALRLAAMYSEGKNLLAISDDGTADVGLEDINDQSAIEASAQYYFGNNVLYAIYQDGDDFGKWYAGGLQHRFSKRTRIYLEAEVQDDADLDADQKDSYGLGIRHDF